MSYFGGGAVYGFWCLYSWVYCLNTLVVGCSYGLCGVAVWVDLGVAIRGFR